MPESNCEIVMWVGPYMGNKLQKFSGRDNHRLRSGKCQRTAGSCGAVTTTGAIGPRGRLAADGSTTGLGNSGACNVVFDLAGDGTAGMGVAGGVSLGESS